MQKSTDTLHIRKAVAADCAAIEAVAMASYSIYLDRMPTKPFPMLDDYAAHISHELVHVLEHNHELRGYIVLMEKDSHSLLLDNIAVHPDSQGAGCGLYLAKFAENWAKMHGYSRICLYTNEVMTENLGWYQRLGYAETHRAVENGYRRIYMEKIL